VSRRDEFRERIRRLKQGGDLANLFNSPKCGGFKSPPSAHLLSAVRVLIGVLARTTRRSEQEDDRVGFGCLFIVVPRIPQTIPPDSTRYDRQTSSFAT